jgi:hypothetical protein
MRLFAAIVLAIVAALSIASAVSVYDGMSFTKPIRTVPNGKLFLTETHATGASPDLEHVRFHIAHVYGSPRERGYAYGSMLRLEITKMMTVDVPLFLIMGDAGKQIANEYLPREIQERLRTAKGFDIWNAILEALLWVYEQQEPYLQLDPTNPISAMDGLADALCDGEKSCDTARRATLRNLVHAVNMFPELVRMGCSTVGSWGAANNATMPGLIQLRALDFGEGPWANNHVVLVEHPEVGNAYASLSFYGLLGIITSVSERLAQTEKLFKDGHGFQVRQSPHRCFFIFRLLFHLFSIIPHFHPHTRLLSLLPQTGTYDGSTLTFVIRRIMETAYSKEEALKQIEETKRTWAVFLGFGDRIPEPDVGTFRRRHDDFFIKPALFFSYSFFFLLLLAPPTCRPHVCGCVQG